MRKPTEEELDLKAVEEYYRFRTCPACSSERMMFMVTADAQQCPDPQCGFVLSGLQVRQGSNSIMAALEAFRLSRPKAEEKPEGESAQRPAERPSIKERLTNLEARVDALEKAAGYGHE